MLAFGELGMKEWIKNGATLMGLYREHYTRTLLEYPELGIYGP